MAIMLIATMMKITMEMMIKTMMPVVVAILMTMTTMSILRTSVLIPMTKKI